MTARPVLMVYCQHSLGMGHLVRSFALTCALQRDFEVVFLNGGPLPEGIAPPHGVDLVNLPPLGMESGGTGLVSRDASLTVEEAKQRRRRLLLAACDTYEPDVLLIELFPFGRKKFAGEILRLIRKARCRRPLVLCSLRDLLVSRPDQQRHDNRAVRILNHRFDAVLVHSDPRLFRLEESFSPTEPLEVPVRYTGFVLAQRPPGPKLKRERRVLVSAGGGIVGAPLFRAALEAHRMLWAAERLPMTLVAGPFLPEAEWRELRQAARKLPGLELHRSMPDLGVEMERVEASVSQCGYNTAMDILYSGVCALVVPFAAEKEDEQTKRALGLARLGTLRVLEPHLLSGIELAREIRALRRFRPNPDRPELEGGRKTAELIGRWMAERGRTSAAIHAPGRRRAGRATSGWLNPLRRSLDDLDTPKTFFFRDDDAGWEDERLYRLLDAFEGQGVAIDLAVIPMAVGSRLAFALAKRMQGSDGTIGLHQHGFEHENHEPAGRKCEFGISRNRTEQSEDLARGRRRLEELFGAFVDPIFTPPWNRCTQATVDCLLAMGFAALSRDATADPLRLEGLPELPVSVDWVQGKRGARIGPRELGRSLAQGAADSRPVGVMLHHAVMTEEDLAGVRELLVLLASHPNARCRLMREVVVPWA